LDLNLDSLDRRSIRYYWLVSFW